jgi:sorting nexin-4
MYSLSFLNRVTDPNMRGYGEGATSAWRRYSEFELLRNYLDAMFPAIVIPPLPEKKVRGQLTL